MKKFAPRLLAVASVALVTALALPGPASAASDQEVEEVVVGELRTRLGLEALSGNLPHLCLYAA